MPYSQRCHFLARLQLLLLLGVDLTVHLFFFVFRHLGAHATVTQWLYTQDYADCCCYRLFSRYSSLWPKYKEEKKKIGTPESTNKAKQQSSLAGSLSLPLFNIFPSLQYSTRNSNKYCTQVIQQRERMPQKLTPAFFASKHSPFKIPQFCIIRLCTSDSGAAPGRSHAEYNASGWQYNATI